MQGPICVIIKFIRINYSLLQFKLNFVKFCFSRGNEVLVNKEGGYLVRTKTTEHADGGVFAGRAAFDSPYMV